MKSSSLYLAIHARARVNAGECFPWKIGKNGHKGVCGGIHFRPEESIDACIFNRSIIQ